MGSLAGPAVGMVRAAKACEAVTSLDARIVPKDENDTKMTGCTPTLQEDRSPCRRHSSSLVQILIP